MKSPLGQLLLLTVFVGIGLWFGVKWFLGETNEFPDSIDIRSMGYLRDDAPASGALKSQQAELESENQAQLPPASFSAPEPMITVEKISEKIQVEKIQKEEPPAGQDAQKDLVGASRQYSDDDVSDGADPAIEENSDGSESKENKLGSVALGVKELDAREKARKRRYAELGLIPRQRQEPTIAIDVSLSMPEQCAGAAVAEVPVGLKFRHESAIIKGDSLNALESLVALYRDCQQGEFVLAENPLGREDVTDMLTQMRFDEVKYFFIQHSVSIDAVQFPEEE